MLPTLLHYHGHRYVLAAQDPIQVKVLHGKATDYDDAFWQELVRRVVRKILGASPIKIKLDFRYFRSTKEYGTEDVGVAASGTLGRVVANGWWEITVDPKATLAGRNQAETIAHEITHIAQRQRGEKDPPPGTAYKLDPLEIEAVQQGGRVGPQVFIQMEREGWQRRQQRPIHTIIKAPPGVAAEDWALLDKPLGELTPDELQRALVVQRLLKQHP
jgi:hypothetical protein